MEPNSIPTFHWADYLVLGLFLLFAMLLGVFIGYRDRLKATSKEFLMGGGDMHYVPVALSIQASFLSAISILTTPTEIYSFGTMYVYIVVSYFVGIPIAAYMYLPTFHRMRLTSAYEYLERRFNRTVRLAGSLTFSSMVILYMAVVLYSPAIALTTVTGLPVNLSIPVCGIVCLIYTVVGGMKATIWNDFFQMTAVLLGLMILTIVSWIKVDGNVWEIAERGGRIVFDDFNPDPTIRTTFWTQAVGATFMNLSLYASSQTIIQKFLSVKKLKDAQKSLWIAALTSALLVIIFMMLGLVMYAYYVDCDPIAARRKNDKSNDAIENRDQLLSVFIMDILGPLPGLPGFIIAATFSAAISSISGSVNSLSAVFLVDFIVPISMKVTKKAISERHKSIIGRSLALGFGMLAIAMAFAAQYFGEYVLQMAFSLFGFIGGPLMGLLSLGLFFPFVNSWGALAGLVSSLAICCWIAIGSITADITVPCLPVSTLGCLAEDNVTTTYDDSVTWTTQAMSESESSSILWVYKLSHMYYSLIALAVAIVVGTVVSLITGRAKNTDPRLTFQWSNRCCCYCPRSVQDCLRCGAAECDDDSDSDSDSEDSNDKDDGSQGGCKQSATNDLIYVIELDKTVTSFCGDDDDVNTLTSSSGFRESTTTMTTSSGDDSGNSSSRPSASTYASTDITMTSSSSSSSPSLSSTRSLPQSRSSTDVEDHHRLDFEVSYL